MIRARVANLLRAALSKLEAGPAKAIEAQYTDALSLDVRALRLQPNLIAMGFPEDSDVPAAAVCIQDLACTLAEARYALLEADLHRERFLGRGELTSVSAVFAQKFYVDDAALRIYAARKHLEQAIRGMFGLSGRELKKYKSKRGGRNPPPPVLGYLEAEHPRSELAVSLRSLLNDTQWQQCRDYRNLWVHLQPPAVEGLGLQYRRRRFWERTPDGRAMMIPIGSGDVAEHTIEDVREFTGVALERTLKTSRVLLDSYYEVLRGAGIRVADEGSFTVKL